VGKGTRKAAEKRAPKRRALARPRSISAPDPEWREVEAFATRRGFASTSDGACQLLRSGLRTEQLLEEYAEAASWQVAQAWADVQAIAGGDRAVGDWDRITQAAEAARTRIRARGGTARGANRDLGRGGRRTATGVRSCPHRQDRMARRKRARGLARQLPRGT
jgi:hypothetical protein